MGIMKITVNIPDNIIGRLVEAACWRFGYQEEVPSDVGGYMVPNPESKEKFAKRALFRDAPKDIMRQYEGELARQQAGVTVTADTGGFDAV